MICRNNLLLRFSALLLLPLLAGCGGTVTEKEPSPVNVSMVTVPENYKMDNTTYELILPVSGATGIGTGDSIVMKLVGGTEYIFPVSEVMGSGSLKVVTDKRITTGFYTLFLLHEGRRYWLGQSNIDLRTNIPINPDSGVNLYGSVICDGVGVPGVVVSDGKEVVQTDKDGIYQIRSEKKWKYVFISIPSGYEVPVQGIMPEFHAALDEKAPVDTPERKDFILNKVDNSSFTLLVLGDMHLADRNQDLIQFDAVAKDIRAQWNATSGPKYFLTLGDMTWDLYWYSRSFCFPEYIKTVQEYFDGIPIFHTMGNHDNDMNSVADLGKSFRYTRDICPTFYSFNIGSVHFVVLDNIDFNNVGSNAESSVDIRGDYKVDITAEQMEWLRKDLAFVPKGSKLVISTHAPMFYPTGANKFREGMTGADEPGEANVVQLLAEVQDYDVHLLTGHTHNNFNCIPADRVNVYEHNIAAVCASWWWSGHLTPGVHISTDGTPGGYGVFTFNGNSLSHYYKASGWSSAHQFRAYDMGKVKEVIVPALGGNKSGFQKYVNQIATYSDNDILINIWDYDKNWRVSVTEEGRELIVAPAYVYDPLHIAAMTAKRFVSADSPNFITDNWPHFFVAEASSRNSTVEIKVTDRNGVVHTETMKRPKAFVVEDYSVK